MTKPQRYLLLLLLLFPSLAHAQESKTHPIEKTLEICIDKDPTTAGVVSCTDLAFRMWDKELNKNYLALTRKLNPEARQSLKAAQLEWLKYRDTEFKLIDNIYSKLQGTMYIPMHLDQKKEFIKNRAEALAGYLDLISESEP